MLIPTWFPSVGISETVYVKSSASLTVAVTSPTPSEAKTGVSVDFMIYAVSPVISSPSTPTTVALPRSIVMVTASMSNVNGKSLPFPNFGYPSSALMAAR